MPVFLSVPPPPVPGSRTEIVIFTPSQVTCAGETVTGDGLVRPLPVAVTRYGAAANHLPPPTFHYEFAIDAGGRTRSIRRKAAATFPGYYVNASDLAPSLAASSFPAGVPRTSCSITYTGSAAPIDAAPLTLLYELASRPETAGAVGPVYDRLRPAGSTCLREPGQYRRLNLPAFEGIAQAPGTASWVFLAFDVSGEGKPGNVRVLGTSGNEALNRAGVRAVSDNRYEPGPGYSGCTYHFHRAGPSDRPAPELAADVPASTDEQPGCAIDPKSISPLLTGAAFPPAFARRRIKGVAAVGYDTAPWGAVGNVRVLASEPDETFGEAARAAFSGARVAESDAGRRGCVQRVRFELPPAGPTTPPVPGPVIAR